MTRRWILWCAAGVSLVAGVCLSLDPVRLQDFAKVIEWIQHWRDGASPFSADVGADYPPWAIVTLVPLLWIPDAVRVPVWIAVNVGLALLIVQCVTRFAPEERRPWLVPALLCLASFRTLGQFSLLSFALALLGATTRAPALGGVWLGLALMKPQVGGVIWLAHVGLRDWRRVIVAASIPILLTIVCAWGVGQSPIRMLQEYAGVVNATHGGSTPFLGHTELETWLWSLFGEGTSLEVAVGLALGLVAPGVIGVIRRAPRTTAEILEWYGFCALTSLLATRHLSYDLVLVTPLIVAWVSWPSRRIQTAGIGLLAWLAVHPPSLWRRVFEPLGLPEVFSAVTELDRVLCLALWLIVTARLCRRRGDVTCGLPASL